MTNIGENILDIKIFDEVNNINPDNCIKKKLVPIPNKGFNSFISIALNLGLSIGYHLKVIGQATIYEIKGEHVYTIAIYSKHPFSIHIKNQMPNTAMV